MYSNTGKSISNAAKPLRGYFQTTQHGLRYTMLRGLEKVKMQATLTFACMNLKKLATWKHRKRLQKPPVHGKNMAASVDNSLPYLSAV